MELVMKRCAKCGARNSHLEYRGQTTGNDLSQQQPKFIGGYLVSTCRRCGYEWVVKSLDEGEQ